MSDVDRPIRVMHLITGLEVGGAETMLLKLVSHIDRARFQSEVMSLTDGGPLAAEFKARGIPVDSVHMRRGWPDPRGYFRLKRCIETRRPHVVQTWLYHADLLGGLAARAAGMRRIAWGIRQTDLSRQGNKRGTLLIAAMCARLSYAIPSRIVCCSQAAREAHVRFGYRADSMILIPNGFDLERFRRNPDSRRSLRRALGFADDSLLVGLIARLDPQKDHANFIRAAACVAKDIEVYFVLCGDGVSADNARLREMLQETGIGKRCRLLGPRSDVPDIMAALDVLVSSSFGEGFSNVVGEAMACAVPCVVTDVGDGALIVGECGRVVPPRDPDALAAALIDLLRLPAKERETLGEAARARVAARFSLPSVVRQYEDLYEEMVAACAA